MEKQYDIFLSYSSKDRPWVSKFIDLLRESEYSVWWDRHIYHGKTWDEYIDENLKLSRIVVVVWSEKSIESRWVRTEAHEGLRMNNGQGLFPIKIDDCTIPLAFRLIQTADLSRWNFQKEHKEFEKFLNSLELTLKPDLQNKKKEFEIKGNSNIENTEISLPVKKSIITEHKPPFYLRWQYLLLFFAAIAIFAVSLFTWLNHFNDLAVSNKFIAYKNLSENKFGFKDQEGRIVIRAQFDSVQIFIEGKALVYKRGHKFYINKKGDCIEGDCPKETEPSSEKKTPTKALKDQEEWDRALNTNNRSAYILYVSKYPKGKYIQEANLRIQRIDYTSLVKKAGNAIALQEYEEALLFYQEASKKIINNQEALDGIMKLDDFFWDKTKADGRVNAYEKYKKLLPDGKYIEDATKRIELLVM